jgi:hypothetical protein
MGCAAPVVGQLHFDRSAALPKANSLPPAMMVVLESVPPISTGSRPEECTVAATAVPPDRTSRKLLLVTNRLLDVTPLPTLVLTGGGAEKMISSPPLPENVRLPVLPCARQTLEYA